MRTLRCATRTQISQIIMYAFRQFRQRSLLTWRLLPRGRRNVKPSQAQAQLTTAFATQHNAFCRGTARDQPHLHTHITPTHTLTSLAN